MIKTIVVENEQPQSEYLVGMLLKNFPEIDVMAICESIPDAINKVKEIKPELIFLDVELRPYTGFDLLEQVNDLDFEVIFTTSYSKYAKKAIKFCALDFIEKPFSIEDLKEAVERFKNKSETGSAKKRTALLHNLKTKDKMGELVGIPVLGGLEFFPVSDIIRCQSSNNYTDIYFLAKKVTATKTLKWMNDLLSEHNFFRVHDSHLINLKHIKSYKRGGEGGVVELTNKQEVDVSRRKKEDFLKVLTDLKMIN